MKTIKKPLFILGIIIILCSSHLYAFNSSISTNTFSNKIPDKPKKKIKFVLRHSGVINRETGLPACSCPNCICSGCPCPLGICHCFAIQESKDNEKSIDIGTAWMSFNEIGQLILEFDQETAIENSNILRNPFVPISGDVVISKELCDYWGVKSITINAGNYELNKNSNTAFGKIVVNATVQN
jgi:hypothetical protein